MVVALLDHNAFLNNEFPDRKAAHNIRMLVWLDGSAMNILHHQAASGGDRFNL